MLFKRVSAGTECAIGEEQCGFRQGRGCMECLLYGRCVKSILQMGKMYSGSLRFEKAYDTIVCRCLRCHGI